MTGQAQPAAKICIRCGTDCSGRPRTKDEQGRYTCKACLEAHAAKARSAKPPSPPRAPEPIAPADAGDGGAGEYLLADDSAASAASQGGPCPDCGTYLPPEAQVCMSCGFSRAA